MLEAIRGGWPERRLVLVFQPHRYSRTRDLFDEFVAVLSQVDVLVLTEVYGAGEQPIAGVGGRELSTAVAANGWMTPEFVASVEELPVRLCGFLKDGDLLLMMGAGNIGALAAQLGREGLPLAAIGGKVR